MKLLLNIPEWAKDRRILVFAGIECLADYNPAESREYVRVKETRCVQCGECCRNMRDTVPPFADVHRDGACIYLDKEVGDNDRWVCSIPFERGINCSADGRQRGCSITHTLDHEAVRGGP